MREWRLLDTPPMTGAQNMALDETLLELKGEGKTRDTMRFLQFRPRCVLVGYHQSVEEEVRRDFCHQHNIEINRRITGGGAIFFDENQLGWEVICDKAFFDVSIPNLRLFRALCDPVVTALSILGIDAHFRPRNDIEVNGRKISGTGGTESEGAFLFQGTMLVDFDVDTMLKALRIPVEKLKAKEIDSVKERVTCLNWELGATPPVEHIKRAIGHSFEKHLGIRLIPGSLTPEERNLFDSKLDHFESPAWIDGVKPRFSRTETVEASYKASAGMVRFTLVVNVLQKRLKNLYITGDFLSFPPRALYDLEARLREAPLDRDHLHGIILDHFARGHMSIPDMDFDDFVKPLDLALEKLDIAKFGIPLEQCNLISVANGSFDEVIRKDLSVLLLPYCAKPMECDLRHERGCRQCGEDECTIGSAWGIGRDRNMKVVSITSFEDLWAELRSMKERGVEAYVGCCCRPFFTKHVDDFVRSGLPGILLDIDDTTCYDLDQAKEAYAGRFESRTTLNLTLLNRVLDVASGVRNSSGGSQS